MNVGDKVRLAVPVKGLPSGLEGTVAGTDAGLVFVRLPDAPKEAVIALVTAEALAPLFGKRQPYPGAFPLKPEELEVIS